MKKLDPNQKNRPSKITNQPQFPGRFWIPLILFVTVIGIYYPSIENGFLYDDYEVILSHPPIQSFEDVRQIFSERHFPTLPYYRPVVRFSLLLQRAIHGDQPQPFHAFNVFLMGIAAVLAYGLLRLPIFNLEPLPALIASFLFALHPVASSCVYPIASGRETLMPGVFILLASYCYLRSGLKWRLGAVLAFALALFSKEQAVVTVIIFVLADFFRISASPSPKNIIRRIGNYLPEVIICSVYFFIRHSLFGGERYITSEMKDYESQILNANERITELETRLFHNICNQVSESATQILSTANAISKLDVFVSFAEQSARSNYVRPELNHGDRIDIYKGRHPVVETTLDHGAFVPNDVRLSNSDEQLIILTGPNMAGKSTYLRQSAIITLMAQIGSFVPAESASIGLVDRIFTRVGLQDDLAMGQSTFMVEMTETAYILNQATSKSFIILDEIGRGTSTYDGLAIAKSVAEHIHNSPKLGCKTLFATHYHELIDLEDVLPRARNYNVSVSENKGEIVFLRHIVRGGSDRSYGIHVARLAGLPNPVINRAWEILSTLEEQIHTSGYKNHDKSSLNVQLSLMDTDQSLLNDILSLDVDALTPLQSIIKLFEIQEMARKKRQ